MANVSEIISSVSRVEGLMVFPLCNLQASQLEVGSGSDAYYRPFNDDDNNKAAKGSSMSWYASLTAAVMGGGASASDTGFPPVTFHVTYFLTFTFHC